MYLGKIFQRRADGSQRAYYVLTSTVWDKKAKRPRRKYLAYIGTEPSITLKKAREIAQKINCSLDELKAVRGLKIVDDGSEGAKRAAKKS
jgi:hypothetical protein